MIEEIDQQLKYLKQFGLLKMHSRSIYVLPILFLGAELYMRGRRPHARMAGMVGVAGSASPRIAAHARLALDGLDALVGALAAVVLVVEEFDALAPAAGVPVLALPVAVAAVLDAGLRVGAGALAARSPGAPALQADRRGLPDAVVVGQRRGLAREEAASPERGRRRVGDGDQGEGQRHEKHGGSPHGGGVALEGESLGSWQCAADGLWLGRWLYEEGNGGCREGGGLLILWARVLDGNGESQRRIGACICIWPWLICTAKAWSAGRECAQQGCGLQAS